MAEGVLKDFLPRMDTNGHGWGREFNAEARRGEEERKTGWEIWAR